eukprot:3514672-Amphidinium_carterae.1
MASALSQRQSPSLMVLVAQQNIETSWAPSPRLGALESDYSFSQACSGQQLLNVAACTLLFKRVRLTSARHKWFIRV